MPRYTKESRWRMPPKVDSHRPVPTAPASTGDSPGPKVEPEDDYSVSAYGDVSLTDAYVVPGTPSTKKPRLKLKHRKPPLPSKLAATDPAVDDIEQEDHSRTYSRSNFLDYLRNTSAKASEMTPTEDFINFFDTLKTGRKSAQKKKHVSSTKECVTGAPSMLHHEELLKSNGPLLTSVKDSSRTNAREHRSSGVKQRKPIPVWDQPASKV